MQMHITYVLTSKFVTADASILLALNALNFFFFVFFFAKNAAVSAYYAYK